MAEMNALGVFVQVISCVFVYAVLLLLYTLRTKVSLKHLFKNGDPWFLVHMPLSVIAGTPIAQTVTSSLI